MHNNVGIAQKLSDVELIALLCRTEDEIEAHRESDEISQLLADFAKDY